MMRLIYIFSPIIYFITRYVARYRVKVVDRNIQDYFPEKSDQERAEIARQFYRNFSEIVPEIIANRWLRKPFYLKAMTAEGYEPLQQLVDEGRNVTLVAMHQGNWEWALQGVNCILDRPIDFVYKPLKQKFIDDFIMKSRTKEGVISAITARDTLRRIKSIEPGRMFLMAADRAPRANKAKYWVTMFGEQRPLQLGTEVIARKLSMPVYFVSIERQSRGKYHLAFEPVAMPPYGDEWTILDKYADCMERAIRRAPSSYFWVNKRAKYLPPAPDFKGLEPKS